MSRPQLRPAQAASASPWLSQAAPHLEVFPNEQPIERHNHNTSCIPEQGALLADASVPPIQGCALYAPYGKFMNGALQLNNTGLYGILSESVWPIPGNSGVLRRGEGTPELGSLYYLPDYVASLHMHKMNDGQISYSLQDPKMTLLTDRNGLPLNIYYESIAFSASGRWMVAVANERLARINLDTLETTLFGDPTWLGQSLYPQLSITNDGRYVSAASTLPQQFQLHDLDSCKPLCEYKDLLDFLPPRAPNGTLHLELRFLSNHSLSFYRKDQVNTATNWSRYVMTAAGHQPVGFEYLAMGDSFASGEGIFNYRPGTNHDSNTCRNSILSYPFLIGAALNLNTVQSVACSGALIKHISTSAPFGLVLPVASVLSQFLPGYLPQIDFLSAHRPAVITLSVGGNNIGFGQKLMRCIEADHCFTTYEDRLEIVRELNGKFDSLVHTYNSLRTIAPDARLYVVGYPELAKDDGDCAWNVRFDRQEIVLSNQIIRYLNKVIYLAAQKAGVAFVDVGKVFFGHRLCENSGPGLAINGLTFGDDHIDWGFVKGPIASESYHPNSLGHYLLRNFILEATSNLTTPMPQPNFQVPVPDESMAAELLDAPKSGRPIYNTNYDNDLANNVVVRQQPWGITVEAGKLLLRPFSEVRAFLMSKPTELGRFITGDRGELAITVTVPESVAPGYHTLHLFGEDPAGQPTDIYKTIYLAATSDDFDGDGIPNTDDTCLDFSGRAGQLCANTTLASISSSSSSAISESSDPAPVSNNISGADPQALGTVAANPSTYRHTEKPIFWPLLAGAGSIGIIRRFRRAKP